MFLRFAIAAACAGLVMSRVSLSPSQVRWTEYVLFGSFTIILIATQYVVNDDLLRQGDIPSFIANMKNGVMGMFCLMVVYGMFIPNDPRSTAKVVLTMALGTILGTVVLFEREDLAPAVEQLHTHTHAGSNVLFLMIGAALATYGTYVVNGLRTELHEAKKFGQYQIGEKLGAGGMGEVYLAEHKLLKRPAPLDLIRADAGADPPRSLVRARSPIGREAFPSQYYRDLRLRTHRRWYFVLCNGVFAGNELAGTRDEVRASATGPGNLLVTTGWCRTERGPFPGPYSRDLKPANVFIAVRGGEADVAKILDFGLVKLTQDENAVVALTGDASINGTPLYMGRSRPSATPRSILAPTSTPWAV